MQRIAQENNRQFDLVIYKGAKHGFDFDASPAFNATAASDAWSRAPS
jgi:dienelactone hydrolase